MKTIVSATVCGLLILGGCVPTSDVEAIRESQRKEDLTRDAIHVLNSMVFVKDTNSGLCFGYSWGGAHSGGPVLVHVPCSAVTP